MVYSWMERKMALDEVKKTLAQHTPEQWTEHDKIITNKL